MKHLSLIRLTLWGLSLWGFGGVSAFVPAALLYSACYGRLPTVSKGVFSMSCAGLTSGSVCTAVCNPGYTSTPAPTTTCVNGQWTRPAIRCMPVCQGLPVVSVPGISWPTSCNSSVKVGGWCDATCSTGWTGSARVSCIVPKWLNSSYLVNGSCTPVVCPNKPALISAGSWPDACNGSRAGSRCIANCSDVPPRAPGIPTSVCQNNGTWSRPSATGCPPPPPIIDGGGDSAVPADVAVATSDCRACLAGTATSVNFTVYSTVEGNGVYFRDVGLTLKFPKVLTAAGMSISCTDKNGTALPACSAPQDILAEPTLQVISCAIGTLAGAPYTCTLHYTCPAAAVVPNSINGTVSFAPLPWNVVDNAANNVARTCVAM